MNRWSLIALILSGNTFTYYCSPEETPTTFNIPTPAPWSKPWDDKIILGGVSTAGLVTYGTFDGYLKDFKFYNSSIPQSQLRDDYL